MNNKLNIEDIKCLIPDYISGLVSNEDRTIIENSLKESAELREFYEDIKSTFEFVKNVKFEEPPAHYFNTLLPRIHEKIETRAARKFQWSNIGAIWKIIVPVAAILLFFILYFVLRSPENQLTKKEIKPIEEIKKDTPKTESPIIKDEKKEPVDQEKDNALNKTTDEKISPVQTKKPRIPQQRENEFENTAENNNISKDKAIDINIDIQNNDELAAIDPDEISIFPGNTNEGIDDETDKALSNLNSNQKDQLIEDLLQSNL